MHLHSLFLAFCLSLTVLAKGGKNGTSTSAHKGQGKNKNSDEFKCAQIRRLTGLTSLVNNSTKLADMEAKGRLSEDQIQKLKDKAANATTELAQLQSNTTLINACVTIDSTIKTKSECRMMQRLDKLVKFDNNATALQAFQAKHNMTAEQVQRFQEEVANATTKLNELRSNSTLVAACQNSKNTAGTNGSSSGTISASKSSAARTRESVYGSWATVLFATCLGAFAVLLV